MATIGDIQKALEIIRKKHPSVDNEFFCAEHDTIYMPGIPAEFSKEEMLELKNLGIFVCEETEGFCCYV